MTASSALLFGPFETYGFMRLALVAILALALANGPSGVLLLVRRMSLVGDVFSHAVMPGAALGFVMAGYSALALSAGGMMTGVAVAAFSEIVARNRSTRDEVGLAAFYLLSLAVGVLLVSTQGSNADLMHVLFGTVLAVDIPTLVLIALIATISTLVLAAIYRPLAVESFDSAFLRAVGGGASTYRMIFLAVVVFDLVAGFQAFGTLFAVGPMLLPAAAARHWTRRIGPSMVLAVAFGSVSGYIGLLLSFFANLPSGPAIVLAAGGLYLASTVAARYRPRMSAPRQEQRISETVHGHS
jgi:zinc/manganese transport system permease protein